jgi:large subunit ribosomal protein L24
MNKEQAVSTKARLRKGDPVMIIAGGSGQSRPLIGKVGKVAGFSGDSRQRVLVEGLNMVTRHQKATAPGKPSGKVVKEAGIHISNLMYYVESLGRPVRLKYGKNDQGERARGYNNPETKKFVALDS